MSKFDLRQHPIHLGLGASAAPQPEFTGDMAWYTAYGERHAADGAEGRLVALHSFSQPWDAWEMHPNGAEVVVCIEGAMTLVQEAPDGSHTRIGLEAGEYAVNAPGVWHTADVEGAATVIFITAGEDTQHRAR